MVHPPPPSPQPPLNPPYIVSIITSREPHVSNLSFLLPCSTEKVMLQDGGFKKRRVGATQWNRHCPCGTRFNQCRKCGGSSVCPHGRQKSMCKECGGKCICPHKRQVPARYREHVLSYTHACVCVHARAHACACAHTHKRARAHASMDARTHICVRARTHSHSEISL